MRREKKKRKDCTNEIAANCIDQFVHSEVATQIDANAFKFKTTNDAKHPIRTWSTCITKKQKYDLFKRSEIFQQHKDLHPGLTMSSATFNTLMLPCAQQPSEVSCANVTMPSLSHLMRSLLKHIMHNESFSRSLSN